MPDLLPVILSGVASGSALALIALGQSIIYKSTDSVNFAIGDIGTLAVFIAYTAMLFGAPMIVTLVIAISAAGTIGMITERTIIRPLGRSKDFVFIALVAMIGFGLLIRTTISEIWGTDPIRFPPIVEGSIIVMGLAISWNKVIATLFAVAAMAFVAWFFSKVPFGISMRASADDPFAARLVGLNPNRIAIVAAFLGCALSGLAMFFIAAESSLVSTLGMHPLFRAFAGLFLGGLSSMPGAVIGGLAIGILDNLAGRFVSANFRDTIVFLVIVGVLFVRPNGLFGTSKRERV